MYLDRRRQAGLKATFQIKIYQRDLCTVGTVWVTLSVLSERKTVQCCALVMGIIVEAILFKRDSRESCLSDSRRASSSSTYRIKCSTLRQKVLLLLKTGLE